MISRHEKKIFAKTFKIATRELAAVKVPQSCQAGTYLQNIIFKVFDSDGLIDEAIDGPLHTLSIRLNEAELVEGARYAFEHGRCVVSRLAVPREPGTVSFLAYHTHFPDLKTVFQLHVYACDLVRVNLEDEAEPIFSHPTSSVSSQNLLLPSQLVSYQSNNLAAYVEDVMGNISDEIEKLDSKICSEEKLINFLDCQKKSLENEIFNLKDEIGPIVESCSGAKELTRHKIQESSGTAASVLCHLSSGKGYEPGKCFREDVIGIVALLGTVAHKKMSRMLSVYLG